MNFRISKKKPEKVFIYCLINPFNNNPFYIGCSVNPQQRLSSHFGGSTYGDGGVLTGDKNELIEKIRESGKDLELQVIDECKITEAKFWEDFYIDLFSSFGFSLLQLRGSSYGYTGIKDNQPYYFKPTLPNRLIDGKDIHYYRRQVLKYFNFFESAKHQR